MERLSYLGGCSISWTPNVDAVTRTMIIIIITIKITPLGPWVMPSIYLHIFLHGVWLHVCSWSSRYQPRVFCSCGPVLYRAPFCCQTMRLSASRNCSRILLRSHHLVTFLTPSTFVSRAPKSKRPFILSCSLVSCCNGRRYSNNDYEFAIAIGQVLQFLDNWAWSKGRQPTPHNRKYNFFLLHRLTPAP